MAERTVVFLDCGNIDRMPVDFLQRDGHPHPQHRPPPRQHPLRHREPRGARGVVHGRDRVAALPRSSAPRSPPAIADALYVGLVTDTGRFMYENTSAEAHRMAAELIEAGVEPHKVYRRLYEDLPFRRLQLLQRALASVRAPRRRRDHARPPDQGGLRGDRRARDRLRGHRRPPARRSRAPRWRCSSASCSADDRDGHAQGEPARHRRPRRRVADRPRARRRRPPPGGRLLHRPAATASWSSGSAGRCASSSTAEWPRRGSSSTPSPPA